MTDRELLELAAKAAGYEVLDWYGERYTTTDGDRLFPWNPLADDGDALRLAVKLGMLLTLPKDMTSSIISTTRRFWSICHPLDVAT